MRCTRMKIYEIEYTGFSAENINDTLVSIELRTLLFKYVATGRGRRDRAAGNSLAGNGSQLASGYTLIKR